MTDPALAACDWNDAEDSPGRLNLSRGMLADRYNANPPIGEAMLPFIGLPSNQQEAIFRAQLALWDEGFFGKRTPSVQWAAALVPYPVPVTPAGNLDVAAIIAANPPPSPNPPRNQPAVLFENGAFVAIPAATTPLPKPVIPPDPPATGPIVGALIAGNLYAAGAGAGAVTQGQSVTQDSVAYTARVSLMGGIFFIKD